VWQQSSRESCLSVTLGSSGYDCGASHLTQLSVTVYSYA
jgi:hypothetical protein